MAGLKTLREATNSNAITVPVTDSTGNYPLFLSKGKDGVLTVLFGAWEDVDATDNLGNDITRQPTEVERLTDATVIPPECPKGCELLPVEMILRNIKSPDAERFRKGQGVDLKAIEADKANGKKRSANSPKQFSVEFINQVNSASCVAKLINVPDDDDEKAMMEMTDANVMKFVKDNPIIQDQIFLCIANQKKFVSLKPRGGTTQ